VPRLALFILEEVYRQDCNLLITKKIFYKKLVFDSEKEVSFMTDVAILTRQFYDVEGEKITTGF
jgi:hypothetical protein